ncbi:MAG: ATP-dependent zinc metalloprotease FtsH [Treponemataceae bacterium]|nr:MAG: ATP-dependent zinc metalloprotease FtsH [Treponemataceae bacterium]
MADKQQHSDNPRGGAGFLFASIILAALGVFFFFSGRDSAVPLMSYSEFVKAVRDGSVSEVRIIDGIQIRGSLNGTGGITHFRTIIPYDDISLMPLLTESRTRVYGTNSASSAGSFLLNALPALLVIILLIVIIKQNSMQNQRGMQFGRSRAKIYQQKNNAPITFADVAGQQEAKKELAEIVSFLKSPKKYLDMGAKIPTGVLLVGSPGTGKTLLARAVAGEAGVSFLHISGSDFVEMFVGVGASRVRDLFASARKLSPAIVFIDELDAVGRSRGAGLGGGHDEREQTLNQMLVEMDGFDNKDGVIILAATNRPDVLDAALLRPGRFDRQVTVSLPDIKEREAILVVHAKKLKLKPDVDLNKFARSTSGMSGADLANLVNEAALFAAGKDLAEVGAEEFELARDKIIMGVARETMVISDKEKRMTAVHEAGHALPYYFLEHVSPLHKVTVIPRGRALGLTVSIPDEDMYAHTRSWFIDQLVVLYGGWAAETLVYDDTTTGTQSDIARATEIARKMVCEWGMSKEMGAIAYGEEEEHIFVGREIARHKTMSEQTARNIDAAIESILTSACKRALGILGENKDKLLRLADALVERETLTDSEIRELLCF